MHKLRELKKEFKDNPNLINIRRYTNHKEVPFGFVIKIKNGLEWEYTQKLEKLGFEIVQIDTIIENNIPITSICIYRHEVEREINKGFLFFGIPVESFADWYDSDFYRKSKEIGTEEYWRVKYELERDEQSKQNKKYWEEQTKVSKLEKEINELKEQNYKLLTKIVNSQEDNKH